MHEQLSLLQGNPMSTIDLIDCLVCWTWRFQEKKFYQNCRMLVFSIKSQTTAHPATICFINKFLWEHSLTHIGFCIFYDCFDAITAELRNSQRLKYELTVFFFYRKVLSPQIHIFLTISWQKYDVDMVF
jgi:hypothetical protein